MVREGCTYVSALQEHSLFHNSLQLASGTSACLEDFVKARAKDGIDGLHLDSIVTIGSVRTHKSFQGHGILS